MNDTYWHTGTVWVYDHYEEGDAWMAAIPIFFLLFLLCLVLYAINCVADTTVGALHGAQKVVYVATLPITLPARWAYERLRTDE